MRFFLDEHLPPLVAEIGRGLRLDVISSHECDRNQLHDDVVLRLAGAEGRCVVTRDVRHFAHWTVEFSRLGQPHAGVLVVPRSLPNTQPERIAHALADFARDHEEGVPSYSLLYL